MFLRIFGLSLAVTIASLIAGFVYGGTSALLLVAILGILEVSLSFDNAVINATVLRRMSEFWQRIFLTVGVLIAVFGMRLLFPLVIVWATAGMAPGEAMFRALNPPSDGADFYPGGTPSYEYSITVAHPQIAAFGGMFLLMLFLDFVFEKRDLTWLSWIEKPLAAIGELKRAPVLCAGAMLVATGTWLAEPADQRSVFIAGMLGMLTYLLVNGLGELFENRHQAHQEAESPAATGASTLAVATGKAGFFLFLYLEVLDASFSFDGVVGAFAITADPIIIALGLGCIGAMFVRSITIYLVRTGSLDEYEYLEHGAHWAIGALAVILLISVDHALQIPEVVTGLIGVFFIGGALLSSIVRNRQTAPARRD